MQTLLTHLKELYDQIQGMDQKLTKMDGKFASTDEKIRTSERHIFVYLENMRQDLLDAHKDDLENVKIRLTRVESRQSP